jgi:cyclophilin family peptidyl-prolyl cis-trans isomerase
MKKSFLHASMILLFTLLVLTGCSLAPKGPEYKQWTSPPAMAIDMNKTYLAHVETNKGNFTIELFAKDAPKTVNNFVFLSKEKFYDNVYFHRIVKNFMIQSGDPKGTGTGGPGYSIEDELSQKYKYEKGIVAMANKGMPNTGGSQFFICTGPGADPLNNQPDYTIFGKIVNGMDTIDKLNATPVGQNASGEFSSPTEEVIIKTVTIEEK